MGIHCLGIRLVAQSWNCGVVGWRVWGGCPEELSFRLVAGKGVVQGGRLFLALQMGKGAGISGVVRIGLAQWVTSVQVLHKGLVGDVTRW